MYLSKFIVILTAASIAAALPVRRVNTLTKCRRFTTSLHLMSIEELTMRFDESEKRYDALKQESKIEFDALKQDSKIEFDALLTIDTVAEY
jgi:hypothetical protein